MSVKHQLTNESTHRILIRTVTTSELTSQSVLGNICEGELIYDKTANKLYICTQSTNGLSDGVLTEIGL